jgi:hypothetical protein
MLSSSKASLSSSSSTTTHKRQVSNGSIHLNDSNPLQTSFSGLDNFMYVTKRMEDEVMVPLKLKDKLLLNENEDNNNNNQQQQQQQTQDVLDHYKFIRLIRNQFLHSNPFKNIEDLDKELKNNENFQETLNNLNYHYTQLMCVFDTLSNEAKIITDIYRANI